MDRCRHRCYHRWYCSCLYSLVEESFYLFCDLCVFWITSVRECYSHSSRVGGGSVHSWGANRKTHFKINASRNSPQLLNHFWLPPNQGDALESSVLCVDWIYGAEIRRLPILLQNRSRWFQSTNIQLTDTFGCTGFSYWYIFVSKVFQGDWSANYDRFGNVFDNSRKLHRYHFCAVMELGNWDSRYRVGDVFIYSDEHTDLRLFNFTTWSTIC